MTEKSIITVIQYNDDVEPVAQMACTSSEYVAKMRVNVMFSLKVLPRQIYLKSFILDRRYSLLRMESWEAEGRVSVKG